MKETKSNSFFATAPIGKLIAKFAIPCVISLLVNALYNIVDQIFIGNGVGYLGNGATTVVFPITIIGFSLASLFGEGGAAFFSLKLGENNTDKAQKGVGNAITLLSLSGIVILILGLIFLKPLLTFFGATEAIFDYAVDYGSIIMIGMPFVIISTGLNSVVRSDGNPKLAMISMVIGAIINTILDPIFIFPMNMGVKGAAYATIIGQIASFIIAVYGVCHLKSINLKKSSFKLKGSIVKNVCALGVSSFITQVSIVIVIFVMNNMLVKYGADSVYGAEIPLTAVGIVMKVNQVFIAILFGIAIGTQPIIGYNYGAGNYSRVKQTFKTGVMISMILGIIACLLFELCPQAIINLFGSGDALYNEFAIKSFRIFLMLCILTSFQTISGIFLQAIGKPVKSAISSLSRQIVFFIPPAIILPITFGVEGVLWAGPCADFLAFILTLIMIVSEIKKLKGDKINER